MQKILKALVLDDSPDRHAHFDRMFPSLEIDHVWNYEQAIEKMEKESYDVIFLDHDLSDEDQLVVPSEESVEKTGSDVAMWLKTSSVDRETLIIIHSLNGFGRDNMENILKDAGFKNVHQIPFNYRMDHMIKVS